MKLAPDVALAGESEAQHGAFTRRQALDAGHSSRSIGYRLDSGRWIALHPTVYCAAGTPASWHRDQMASCLWSGGAAAGIAAGFLHGLPGCEDPPLEVMTHRRIKPMPRCGIVVHVTNRLPADQIVYRQQIPVTSIERTLMSLAAIWRDRRVAIALDNALYRGLTSIGDLDYFLYRTARRGRNGTKRLRQLMRKRVALDEVPNTPLESVIFEMLADSHLEMPFLQHEIYDHEGRFIARPDFVFPEEKLIIEGHSKLWHSGAEAQERDWNRHGHLEELDYAIVYLSWSDATRCRTQTVARIDALLAQRSLLFRGSERAGVCAS